MKTGGPRILVLALGNDLLGDDGVAWAAARALREQLGDQVVVVESAEAGLALVELLEGYDCALLLDSIMTGTNPPGSLLEFTPADFTRIVAPSPHYAGLPEVLELARRLGLDFPTELRILAMEVENPWQLCESLSPGVREALPRMVDRSRLIVQRWTLPCQAGRTPGALPASKLGTCSY